MGTAGGVTEAEEPPKVSVVLVDDSAELRALVRRRLERSGHFDVVGEGGDGDEAISLVIRHEPALLLLDTSMPTCDGIQALPAIRAVCPETKVVMFTGFHEESLADRVRELGAADLVEKSIPLEDLPGRLLSAMMPSAPSAPAGTRGDLRLVRGREPGRGDAGPEQQVLDEHVAQFQDLFDRAAIGMATLTVHGTVVRANQALADLMSCAPYDLVGVDYGQLMHGAGDELDKALHAIAASGRDLATIEHPVPPPRGESPSRLARLTLAPIRDAQRQVLYVFAQVQDISALRAAEVGLSVTEQNFRLLVAAVGEYAIYMLDLDGNVASWNAGAQRIKGYAPREIIGRSFGVFYPPDERASGHPERNLEAARRDGEYAEEGWRVRKDGSRFWASVVISAIYDDAGQHIGFAKVTRDQSKQRKHEQERREFIEQQIHLLAVTAHELRTPTAVIEGSVGVLKGRSEPGSDGVHEAMLSNIRSSTHRLRRLGSDLATASQLHGGTLQYRLDDVSLSAVLQGAAARREAAENAVHIDLDVPHDVTVRADAERLAQAIDNLLDNAVRHGSAPVMLAGAAEKDSVHIRVSDGGRGVPAKLVPRLFERFVHAGVKGGTGLGLYLVHQIAAAHGGHVVYRPPGHGRSTEFAIRLPRVT
jgi:PAS domain S-box-containing protein